MYFRGQEMRLTCPQLVVANREKKCYANPYFARVPWPVHSVNRLPGGVDEQEHFSAAFRFLSSSLVPPNIRP